MVDTKLAQVVLESLRKHPPTTASSGSTTSSSSSKVEYKTADLKFTSVARLWGGMGYIYRVDVQSSNNSPGAGCQVVTSRIVKYVRLPQSSSSLSRGDQRKADSYHCEANFYQHVVPLLQGREGSNVDLPETFHVERTDKSVLIVMSHIETASDSYFLTVPRTQLVLTWLARFHAATWGAQWADKYGLQTQGTYWYLDTRPDEHASMSNRGWEGRLKLAARAINDRLQRDSSQCLVHGDTKEANLLFDKHDKDRVVLCDFQYCGRGTPAQDLAYFFCSSIEDLDRRELDYLQHYLGQLEMFLPADTTAPTLTELQDSLDWAYCDFQRFMCGWGNWGNSLQERVKAKLNTLDDGKSLGSEEAYSVAMQQRFG